MGPIHRTRNPTVLHRVEMNVIHMPRQIGLIPDLMLPIAPLPDATLAFGLAADADVLDFSHPPRKPCLDLRPAQRIIGVVRGQTPNRVQVFGQHHQRQQGKGMRLFYFTARKSSIRRTNISESRSARFTVKK